MGYKFALLEIFTSRGARGENLGENLTLGTGRRGKSDAEGGEPKNFFAARRVAIYISIATHQQGSARHEQELCEARVVWAARGQRGGQCDVCASVLP